MVTQLVRTALQAWSITCAANKRAWPASFTLFLNRALDALHVFAKVRCAHPDGPIYLGTFISVCRGARGASTSVSLSYMAMGVQCFKVRARPCWQYAQSRVVLSQ